MHKTEPPRRHRHGSLEASGDAELIGLVRRGDAAATAELWRRHAAAGRTVARAWSASLDADDLVSEAFLRVLAAIERGGGPEGSFRAYFFTSIRNVASSWGRRQGRERPFEPETHDRATQGPEEHVLAALERDLSARAFRALPPRWQEVLWYTEVEGLSAAEVAPLLGLRPNGVAALSLRAREGLRGAWIREHLGDAPAEGECRWVLERAGTHARGRLAARDRMRLRAHLAVCEGCTAALAEAENAGRRLATVLLPLAAGLGGAAAFAAHDALGGAVAVASAAEAGPPPGSTGSASAQLGVGGGSAGGTLVTATLIAAGLVLVGGIAVAALLPGSAPVEVAEEASEQDGLGPATPGSGTPSRPAPAATPAVAALPTPPPGPSGSSQAPPSGRAGPASSTEAASGVDGPIVAMPPSTAEPTAPTPTTAPPAPAVAAPPLSTAAPSSPARTAVPLPAASPAPATTAPPTTTPPSATATTLIVTEDPEHHLLPDVHGTAAPNAFVALENARTGQVYARTRTDADGHWAASAVPLPVGSTSLLARAHDTAASTASEVTLDGPRLFVPGSPKAGEVPVVVAADSGIVQLLLDGNVVHERTAVPPAFAGTITVGSGAHTIGVRYVDGAGRVGPTVASVIVVR
ncbi:MULTISPECIES: sigma-70 family RNA polymerase sigma factor [unclassified Rathayibacter]|uniref:sigma-70 family RNA polymerase sigma factor n=1 Tax=unclassified Rathayibacter TaxID=2609250 RepID=UPI00188B3313|nr:MULTISPECIES: sigma-70 family RNA polymerase sigma factor [unclassified Rathayibacter]MBF4461681.1 sigma-70 family RNA polymerase sigma factor [Rathayibacter sp. VKM Ac-2879]MBF4503092.1 sigma-70 family RNA polymerase sigma factor [Rathayibacter sp. VKM Ac-2878]